VRHIDTVIHRFRNGVIGLGGYSTCVAFEDTDGLINDVQSNQGEKSIDEKRHSFSLAFVTVLFDISIALIADILGQTLAHSFVPNTAQLVRFAVTLIGVRLTPSASCDIVTVATACFQTKGLHHGCPFFAMRTNLVPINPIGNQVRHFMWYSPIDEILLIFSQKGGI
jgi:hypothetical protein